MQGRVKIEGETERQRTAAARRVEEMTRGYRPLPGVYDELMDADGTIRPSWNRFLGRLGRLGLEEIARRWETAQRQVQDSGVTYNVYGDPAETERLWPLSPLPMVIEAAEWRTLSAALIQRAKLLNAVVADAFGHRRMIAEGHLPAALVMGNPEFLRPLDGIQPPDGTWLHLYAADLGRGPDGRWWVLSDRTQAPSGAGYALENRIVMSRTLPEIYREMRVERLAGFFQAFRQTLHAQTGRDDPNLCLLTPGPRNETYFEHAYLARYLGFSLVEGGDLTVRDRTVFVKTIAGLKPAHAILRRLDADYADPLELNTKSRLGVPGLISAIRSGQVVMANALGSALVECRALMSFLPSLSRALLGEELAMPSVATWWCGQPGERDHVIEHLDEMVISPTFATWPLGVRPDEAIVGAGLGARERAALIAAIRTRGADFIGQEMVGLSTAPVWAGGRLRPRPMALRVYVAATRDGWTVMPGGLCRMSERLDARALSMQRGDAARDVWILSDGPVQPTSLLSADNAIHVKRGAATIPSRTADNLFWLGRYVERTESLLRVVRCLLNRTIEDDFERPGTVLRLRLLLHSAITVADPAARAAEAGERVPSPLEDASLALSGPAGDAFPALTEQLIRTASVIRERLSPDAWQILNDLGKGAEPTDTVLATGAEALGLVQQRLRLISAFSGLSQENMIRGSGWRFLDMGRRVERALTLCRWLENLAIEGDPASGDLEALLELGDSVITYRARYVALSAREPVVDLLALDMTNPRSVVFQLSRIDRHLSQLPQELAADRLTAAQRIVSRALTALRVSEAGDLMAPDAGEGGDHISVRQVAHWVMDLSDRIAGSYFSHLGAAPQPRPVFDFGL